MYDPKQFAIFIGTVLRDTDTYSIQALVQLLGTAAVESDFGTYLWQKGGGPARGPFQMEPSTARDVWERRFKKDEVLRYTLANVYGILRFGGKYITDLPIHNLAYAVIMARLKYILIPEPFPKDVTDVFAYAMYWKKYYNTVKGKGSVEKYVAKYGRYVKLSKESLFALDEQLRDGQGINQIKL